jgi:hypothetical protein
MSLQVGDPVTVAIAPDDPIEITVHSHAIITQVEDHPDGLRYEVGHPPATRRYGPYRAERLTNGWVTSR